MGIISGNYDLVYNITWKIEIYRDTGKKAKLQVYKISLGYLYQDQILKFSKYSYEAF